MIRFALFVGALALPFCIGIAANRCGRAIWVFGAAVATIIVAVALQPRLDVLDVVVWFVALVIGTVVGRFNLVHAGIIVFLTAALSETTLAFLAPEIGTEIFPSNLLLDAPRTYRERCTFAQAVESRPRRVLYLGDSMSAGYGLRPGQVFSALLQARQRGVDHVNASVPNSGPDCALHVLRSVPSGVPVDQIIVFLYSGNDLEDIGHTPGHPFEAPLFEIDSGGALVPQHDRGDSWLSMQARGPSPVALRTLSQWSRVASGLATVVERLRLTFARRLEPSARVPGYRPLLEATLRDLSRESLVRGAAFRIVVLPDINSISIGLESPSVAHTTLVQLARGVDKGALDATHTVSKWFGVLGKGMYLKPDSSDFHWSAEAHAKWSDWIEREVE